jgi:hypothetical protein
MVNFAVFPGSQPHSQPRLRPTRTEYHSAGVDLSTSTAVGPDIPSSSPGETTPDYEELYRITGEMPGGHWLYYALPVRIRIEGSEFVAIQPQLSLMAFGNSPGDAILNLRTDLVEHYERLVELGNRLGPQLVRQRDLLRKLFTEPDA